MHTTKAVLSLFALLGTGATAQALTIDVPLDADSWFMYPPLTYQVGADKGTLTNDLAGHLVATKTTATGGSNLFLGRDTVATYDLQDATLQYQWKLNGLGLYAGTYNGLLTDAHGGLAYYKAMTTHHSYGGSLLIPSDTWLYTEYAFSEAGHAWEYSIGTGGYGTTDIAHGVTALADGAWIALAKARPFIWIGDNYAAGAYLELARMTITAVPEPTTLALMLAGLAGVGLLSRRARA